MLRLVLPLVAPQRAGFVYMGVAPAAVAVVVQGQRENPEPSQQSVILVLLL